MARYRKGIPGPLLRTIDTQERSFWNGINNLLSGNKKVNYKPGFTINCSKVVLSFLYLLIFHHLKSLAKSI